MFRKVAQLPLDYNVFKDKKSVFAWAPSGAIIFGNGAVAGIGEELKKLGAKKTVLVTDQGLVKCGVAQKLINSLTAAGLELQVYDGCEADSSVETVAAITAIAREADILIGLGGGSSIDSAKAASIVITNGGDIRDYQGCDKFTKAPLPLVAVPTAAGTGTECTPFAVIADRQRDWKMPIGGAGIMPSLVIADPELTYSLPPSFTAATGMDALTHAIEAYTSRCTEPISDALSSQAIKLIAKALRPVVYRGDIDKDARYDMMMGSMLAGYAFTSASLGISHCMAHPLGAIHHVPHGVANAICLPVVMEFNMGAWPERYADIAVFFGLDISGLSTMEAAKAGVQCVYDLLADLPIDPLRKWSVTEGSLDRLSDDAMKGGDRPNNARMTTKQDFITLYKKALALKL
jgi:alcohol dehydrogenase class IV